MILRPVFQEGFAEDLVQVLREAPVVDVSLSPAYWGHALRGSGCQIMARLSKYESPDGMAASLIEALSCIGRNHVHIALLPSVSPAIWEAAREAQAEGLIGFIAAEQEDADLRQRQAGGEEWLEGPEGRIQIVKVSHAEEARSLL